MHNPLLEIELDHGILPRLLTWQSFTGAGDGIGSWDVSSITSMNGMFHSAFSFTGDGIGEWDTSKVTDMNGMFYEATSFTGDGIGSWDVSEVVKMHFMFSMRQLPLEEMELVRGMFPRLITCRTCSILQPPSIKTSAHGGTISLTTMQQISSTVQAAHLKLLLFKEEEDLFALMIVDRQHSLV